MVPVTVEAGVDRDAFVALLRLGLAFDAVLVVAEDSGLDDRVVLDAVAGVGFRFGRSVDLEQVVGRRHRRDLALQRLVLAKQRRQLRRTSEN